MTSKTQANGGCACGAVRIAARNMSGKVGACHCSTCRRWGGGPLLAVDCGDDIELEGGEHISVFDSSEWAERGFCSKCGSHLFYRLKQNNQHIVPVGLFGDDHPFVLDHQVFIDERPEYYRFANETTDMTGKEVFEKYGG